MIPLLIVLALSPTFYDDGTCQDETGAWGVWSVTPPCYTTAVYDEVFSVENLSTVPSHIDPTRPVADVYHLGDEPASQRPRVFMGVELPTFAEVLEQVANRVHVS